MPLNCKNASFFASYALSEQLPASSAPEVSFAGRSNVGKSSLLNALMYRKDLAKVSSTPGKTATINFYDIDGASAGTPQSVAKHGAFFVDLPGYGYAQKGHEERERWSTLIEDYFNDERFYALVVCLVDIRLTAQEADKHMIAFLQESGFPFAVVFTKADKLSRQQAQRQAAALRKSFGLRGETPTLITSSATGEGIDALRKTISAAVDAC